MSHQPIRREAVTLANRQGALLHAVLTSPAREVKRPRLLLFSQAGLQNKGGVGDYFRWLADELAGRGLHVLRFDQAGTGDSGSEIAEDIPLEEYFVRVQSGVSTDDTLDMLAWARRRLPRASVVLWGQCGGCVATLQAAARETLDVDGLVLLAFPTLLSGELTTVRGVDAKVAERGYMHRLKDPRAYLRLLGGQSDYRLIGAVLRAKVRQVKKHLARRIGPHLGRQPLAAPDHPQFNRMAWDAFLEVMERGIPVLFLMAELDNETPDFNDEFKVKVLDRRPSYARLCAVVYLKQADHSLQVTDARLRSRDEMLKWLEGVWG